MKRDFGMLTCCYSSFAFGVCDGIDPRRDTPVPFPDKARGGLIPAYPWGDGGKNLMLVFPTMLGDYFGLMPVLEDRGSFRDLGASMANINGNRPDSTAW
jgi:hypothetical protein